MPAAKRSATSRDPFRIGGLITHLDIFSDRTEPQALELASRTRLLPLRRGTALVRRGEPLPGLLGVSYGLLKIAARSANGDERVLRLLGANESFGAAPILLERPCPVDITAVADALVLSIAPAAILELLDRDAKFARRLMIALAEYNLGLISEFADNALHRGVQRLAGYLESIARPYNGSGRFVATLPAAKSLVASRLGMKKETLSRLLHELAADGIVSVCRREITLLDRARLAGIARDGNSARPTGDGRAASAAEATRRAPEVAGQVPA